MRIALEAGTHSPWISQLLVALGHEALVANPRKLRLIAESDAKHDRADACLLARLAHVGPALLSPIHSRSAQTQIDLAVIRAREVAVQTRTKLVNAVRGMVNSTGHRLPASPTLTFARKATEACPEALRPALRPLIRLVETLTADIAAYDRLVVEKAHAYPETQAIQTIDGVGALTAVAFVLVLNNDRSRFKRSRQGYFHRHLPPMESQIGVFRYFARRRDAAVNRVPCGAATPWRLALSQFENGPLRGHQSRPRPANLPSSPPPSCCAMRIGATLPRPEIRA